MYPLQIDLPVLAAHGIMFVFYWDLRSRGSSGKKQRLMLGFQWADPIILASIRRYQYCTKCRWTRTSIEAKHHFSDWRSLNLLGTTMPGCINYQASFSDHLASDRYRLKSGPVVLRLSTLSIQYNTFDYLSASSNIAFTCIYLDETTGVLSFLILPPWPHRAERCKWLVEMGSEVG